MAALNPPEREADPAEVSTCLHELQTSYRSSSRKMHKVAVKVTNYITSGNATDIGTTYVHYLENRRPKYHGVRGFEAERHSLSYVFDVCTNQWKTYVACAHFNIDVATCCPKEPSSRLDPCSASSFVTQQSKAPCQRGEVDTRRTAAPHW